MHARQTSLRLAANAPSLPLNTLLCAA